MEVFDRYESGVRNYCRAFPEVFVSASGVRLRGRDGREYLDFFAGAGALNYGHNPPPLRRALIEYLEADGIVQGLDLATAAKERFLLAFNERILAPRGLAYRMLFPGPTGANCVEVALKLARRATGRQRVLAFDNGFHGMSLGALAATANPFHRAGAGVALPDVDFVPYDDGGEAAAACLPAALDAAAAGEPPAACLVEAVQGEGGCHAASADWLRALAGWCRARGSLLIVDDIQAGCGRTGHFFGFESAGIEPDIVCLSKSLSGFGLPLSLALVRPSCDVLQPGQHSGTFRGHNPAFVTATAALETWWRDDALMRSVAARAATVEHRLAALAAAWPEAVAGQRGRGLLRGLVLRSGETAEAVRRRCFARGLVIETCGAGGTVLKVLCPLTIGADELDAGLDCLSAACADVLAG